jgi:hypothetical protein
MRELSGFLDWLLISGLVVCIVLMILCAKFAMRRNPLANWQEPDTEQARHHRMKARNDP